MSHLVSVKNNIPNEETNQEELAETHPLIVRRWAIASDGRFRRTHSCSHLLAA